jgi:hypothetical protein
MARRSAIGVAALAIGCALATQAGAEKVRVAVYAPWAGPSTADDRHELALQIEAAGDGVEVSSFAKLKDFRRALNAGSVDLALVDSGVVSSLGKRSRVIASWSSGKPWVIAGNQPHPRLRSLRLALQARDAPSSIATVTRLLRGQMAAGDWGKVIGAPVTADARQVVARGEADVVIIPRRDLGSLSEIATLGEFSELALAAIGTDEINGAATAVKSVVRDRLGGSWSSGRPAFPKTVRITALVTADAAVKTASLLDLLAPTAGSAPKLPIEDLWVDPQ